MGNLRDQIGELSAAEKMELLDAVWESLETEVHRSRMRKRAELDARISQLEQNPSDVIPWERVKAGLFKKP